MTIIIDPQSSGIAGNMIIGALVDLGANPDKLKEIMEKSAQKFGKIEVTFDKIVKHGISSTFCHVKMLENPGDCFAIAGGPVKSFQREFGARL